MQYLKRYDMQAHVANPSKGFETIKQIKPDLMILDVMLPEKDGFEIAGKYAPSLHPPPPPPLTAHAEVTDRIVGLNLVQTITRPSHSNQGNW